MSDDANDESRAGDLYRAADTLSGEKGGRHRAGRKAKRKRNSYRDSHFLLLTEIMLDLMEGRHKSTTSARSQ